MTSNHTPSTKTVDLSTMPLNWRHLWIVFVASLGQLIGTGVATLAGVIIPMINIMRHPELSSFMQGLIGAVDLIGIAVGSVIFGKLIDKYGYLFFFRFCPALILGASIVAVFVPTVSVLVVCLFLIGLGIGGEYSLDSGYISILLPVKWRPLMIGVAKTASALGNIFVALVCYFLITGWANAARWPDLMWIVAAIAALMLITRIWFYQSPSWLESHGKTKEAEEVVEKFLGSDVRIAPTNSSTDTPLPQAPNLSLFAFIKKYWSRVMLSGIPWACEGLGVYGIGVFLPILVMALGIEHISDHETAIAHVGSSVWVTFLISCIMLPGFILGLWLIQKKKGLSKIQSIGFWLCAISLVVLLLSYHFSWNKWISISAFMVFELFLNMGPHLVTYVLPPKVYPVEVRGMGSGLAASLGKIGAVLAVFIIPVLLSAGGPVLVLAVSAAVMVIGALVTQYYTPKVFNQKS